jgi:hypothetical protein
MENIENTKDTVEAVAITDVGPITINSIRLPWNDVARLMFQGLILSFPVCLLVWMIYFLIGLGIGALSEMALM